MEEPILTVKALTVKMRAGANVVSVVDALSFDLYAGKTLALVGESGCGKTMTALSLLRILPSPPCLQPEGAILYRGRDLLQLSEREMRKIRGAKISMIFQDPSSALNPVYTIGDQLIEVAELHLGLHGEEAVALAVKALSDVGIPLAAERLDDYPHQLSGGMRQRVMIAMALMCEPDVIIADEPTTALDVTIQAQVLELFKELQQRRGTALLLITHDMGVVAEIADDVIVMYASQAVEQAGVEVLFDKMAHPYTRGLFDSRPATAVSRDEPLKAIPGSVPPIGAYPTGCRFHPRCCYKMDKCCIGNVPFFAIEQERHHAACWLWDGSGESAGKVKEVDDAREK